MSDLPFSIVDDGRSALAVVGETLWDCAIDGEGNSQNGKMAHSGFVEIDLRTGEILFE